VCVCVCVKLHFLTKATVESELMWLYNVVTWNNVDLTEWWWIIASKINTFLIAAMNQTTTLMSRFHLEKHPRELSPALHLFGIILPLLAQSLRSFEPLLHKIKRYDMVTV